MSRGARYCGRTIDNCQTFLARCRVLRLVAHRLFRVFGRSGRTSHGRAEVATPTPTGMPSKQQASDLGISGPPLDPLCPFVDFTIIRKYLLDQRQRVLSLGKGTERVLECNLSERAGGLVTSLASTRTCLFLRCNFATLSDGCSPGVHCATTQSVRYLGKKRSRLRMP